MHPFKVEEKLRDYGFWYTYWDLRNTWLIGRGTALWLIWVGFWLTRPVRRTLDRVF